jgi:hypothetical protein
MKKLYSITLSALLLMVFSSCLKDTLDEISGIKGVQATGSFSAPILSSTLTLKDLYESYSQTALIKEQSDNLLVFVYRAQDTIVPDKLVQFPSTSSDFELQMTPAMITIFEAVGDFDFTIDDSLKLPTPNNEQIRRLNVKDGKFDITFVSEYKHNITITISYPSITKNGLPITEVVNVNYDPLDYPKTVRRTVNLSGYDVDFTRGGVTSNSLPFSYKVEVTRLPANATLPTEKLAVNQIFSINGYNLVEGYLGRFTILDEPNVIDIDLFSNSLAGQIFLADPRLVIRLYNTFGVPITGTISDLKVIDQSGNNFPVTIQPFQDTFSFANPAGPGQIGVSEFIIDRNNSNLDDVINSRPKQIVFRLKAEANYREDFINNFLLDTSLFAVDFDSEIPFDIKIIDYITQKKSLNNSFSSMSDNIQEVRLEVKTENKLPFDLTSQMLFTRDSITLGGDTIDIPIDSLFSVPLYIPGGIVDANGEIVSPSVKINYVTLPIEKYKRIQSAPNNIFRMKASSSQFQGAPGFVKVKTNLNLNMKIGGDVKVTFKSK